jgi:hypothetical protein
MSFAAAFRIPDAMPTLRYLSAVDECLGLSLTGLALGHNADCQLLSQLPITPFANETFTIIFK